MELSEQQKNFVKENANKIKNLIDLTKQCFEDDTLDGRSKQGRAVRKYLVENCIDYKTTGRELVEVIELTQQQKDFILEQAEQGLSSLEIAKIIFADKQVKPLSNEQRTVLSYIREINPDIMPSQDSGALNSYIAPKSPSRIINNYLNESDRVLFEHEFIRLTWDKPDLTADEINLYLNACKEVINLEVISSHLNKLNDMFDIADDQTEMSVRLAEIIKAKSQEYHQCETRIENLTKKLQGDRAERMKKSQKENASFLSIVQLFQEEEERKNMIRIAEMQKIAVKEECERLEGMAEWKARILGIGPEDVI